MGLLSSISKIALTPSAFIGKKILQVIKPSSQIAQQPLSKTTTELSKTTFGKVLGTAITATAIAIPVATFPSASLKIAKSVASYVGENPIKSFIGGAVVIPALATSPKLRSGGVEGIKEIPSFGTGLGEVIEGEQGIGEFISKHPITSTIVAVVGAVAGGKVIAPVIGGALAGRDSEIIIEGTPQETGGFNGQETTITPTNPTTPQTVYLDDKPKTKQKKRRSQARREQITQRVNLIVSQNNKNYSVHRKSQTYLNRVPQYN